MPDEKAATAESAPATEHNAADVTESATGQQQAAETGQEAKGSESTQTTEKEKGPEPGNDGGELGEKGKAELIKLRKRAQEAERRTREAEIEAAYHRGGAEAGTGKTEEKTPAGHDEYHVPRPVQGENETFDDFHVRLNDWTYDRREWRKGRDSEATRKAEEARTFQTRINEQKVRGEGKYGEAFEEAVTNIPKNFITPGLAQAIFIESEMPEDIVFYLGNNPAELDRIKALSDTKKIKEIARIEDKLKAGALITQKTKAPDPTPTVKAGAFVDSDARYLDPNISTAERIRISQERKKAAARGQ